MTEPRPPIPWPVQRKVRQRCGFGCVICGVPLYEYHHMKPFSEEPEHKPNNITLLCDSHHKQATNSLLPPEQITTANADPFNLKHGITSPFGLNFAGSEFSCVIGSNTFTGAIRDDNNIALLIPISIDDTDLIAVTIEPDGNLFLHANIFDEYNLPLLLISANCLVFRTDSWDIDFRGTKLTVREAARKIFFEIDFQPPNKIIVERAHLLCNGVEIIVRKQHIFVANSSCLFSGNTMNGCAVGIQIGRNMRGLAGVVSINPTANSRYHITDVESREREAIKQQKELFGRFGIDPMP